MMVAPEMSIDIAALEILGKGKSDRARLYIAEGERKESSHATREDTAFIRNVVDDEIDRPRLVSQPSAQIQLRIGGISLPLRRRRKLALAIADIAHRRPGNSGYAAGKRES